LQRLQQLKPFLSNADLAKDYREQERYETLSPSLSIPGSFRLAVTSE